ncbi:hypothetical protein C7N43_22930 [Sphingobacteriales bacterium UPWRP_1]|nr:hypothetical protein B6N25_14985 [Sphingobacteriales bacterium TSM_CSS]PSJ74647.1 hypothetical protein C7N43_22930 [Sphingobacteriales bacterium UPWRP_1]
MYFVWGKIARVLERIFRHQTVICFLNNYVDNFCQFSINLQQHFGIFIGKVYIYTLQIQKNTFTNYFMKQYYQLFALALLFLINPLHNLQAQCTLTTAVYIDTLVCGQCANLYAFGQGQGQVVFSENFNSGSPTGWAFTNQAQFNNPCSPGGADGTPHLWMGNTSGVPRILRTVSYNFTTATAGVTICFDMLFAEQTGDPADAPCEGPDEPDEGVYLQYSTNNGTTWNTINYFDPNGGGDPQLINWNNWCFELPPAALTANCQIRWFQDNDSGQDYDHWGIDNVEIYFNDPTYNITWNHDGYSYGAGNSGGMNPNAVCPQNTTTYTATMTNGTTTCTSSVTVIVRDPDIVVNAGPDPAQICPGQCATLDASNTRIIVSPAKTPTYFNGEVTSVSSGLGSESEISINITELNMTTILPNSITQVCIEGITFFGFNIFPPGTSTIGNLNLFLECPNGTRITLVPTGQTTGSSLLGYTNTCFVPVGPAISTGTAPYSGTYQSNQPFNNLVGCTANGVWNLVISSNSLFGAGAFYGWSISFNDPEISEPAIISWSPTTGMTGANTLTPNVCPTTTTTYTLSAADAAGCVAATDQVTVTVGACGGVPTPCTATTGCFGNNLVTNGNFESFNPASPFATFTSNYDYSPCPGTICTNSATGAPILCQYDFSVQTSPNPCNADWSNAIGDHTTGSGNMMIVDFPAGNVGANNKIWCQTINLAPATDYCFGAFFINILPAGSGQPQPVFGFTQNNTLLGSSASLPESEQWQFLGMQFNSGAGGNTTLCITNQNFGAVGYDLAIDDISVRPVTNGTPPDAVNDNLTLCPGQTSQVLNVLSNDVAGAGGPITALNIIAAPPFTDGDITNINLSAGTVTFTSLPGFTGSTTFTYQVCNASGCCDVATVTLSPGAVTPPSIPPASVCQGGAGVTLNAGNSYSSYAWSTGATGQSITVNPAATTTYTVTVTNTSGCTASASVAVTVNNLTPPSIPGASSCTPGSPVALNAGGGYTNYAWSTGANTQTINVSPVATTTYTVTVTGAGSCTASASATVTVGALPPPVIPPATSCTPGGAITLNAGGGYTGYTWSTGATGQSITVTPAATTNYTVTVTASGGCTASAAVSVTVSNIAPPVMSLPSLCLGGNPVTLDAGSPGPYTAYTWSTGATSQTITINPAVTTAYNVTVTNAAGCTATAGTTVTVNSVNQPVVASASICPGQTATLTAVGTGFTSYTWSNGATTPAINVSPAATTAYTVTVSGAGGCTATTSATVTVFTVMPPVIPPAAVCSPGSSAILNAGPGYAGYAWSTGATAQSISVNPAATTTYTITVTGTGGCTTSSNVTVTVNNISPPVFTPVSICSGGAPVVLDAGAGYTGYLWSTGATTQTVSVSPVASANYTVTVTGTGGCTASASALVTVNNATPPVFTPVNTCSGGSAVVLDAGTGYTGYLWSTGAATQTISVTPAATTGYTVTVTDAGGCTATSDVTITVNSITPPVIPDATICSGNITTLNAGSGYEGYLWSTGETSASINVNPTAGTTYTVTVTGVGGCTASSNVTVTVNNINPPVFTPVSTCSGGSPVVLDAGTGYTGYLWSTGATTQTVSVSPAASANYTVTVTGAGGCTASATALVTVNNATPPVFTPVNTCSGGSAVVLDAGTGYTGYLWSTGAATQTISVTPSATTGYTVTVTDAGGCTATSAVTVTVNSITPPVIPDATICSGNATTLNAGTGYTGYLWSTGATSASINVNPITGTTYTVTVTGAGGCTATATATVMVNPVPTFTITGSNTFCAGSITSLGVSGSFSQYNWSTGATTPTITVSAAGAYSVTVTDANTCTATQQTTVTQSTSLNPAIGGNTNLCPGDAATLDAGLGFNTYLWSNGSTGQTLVTSTPGIYSVTVSDAGGCTGTDSETVTVNAPPTVSISGNNNVCAGTATPLNATPGLAQYVWSTGAFGQTINATIAGTYSVTATDANGCTASDNFTLTVNPPPTPAITGNLTICPGSNTVLDAGTGYIAYNWSNGSNGQTANAGAAGVYSVTVTDTNGCQGSAAATVSVTVVGTPAIGGNTTICPGSSTILSTSGFSAYNWSTGATTASISVSPAANTTYTVTVTNAAGCTATNSVTVNILATPIPDITGTATICAGNTSVLDAGTGFAVYLWSNGAASPAISVTTAGTYTVTVTNASGCTGSDSFAVAVNPLPVVNISGSTTFCAGGNTTLNAGASFTTYNWSNGANTATITVTAPGTYGVTVTNGNGCTGSAQTTVTVSTSLNPNIVGDVTLCPGENTVLDAGTGYASYLWSDGSTAQTLTSGTAGAYSVTVSDSGGCTGTASTAVVVNSNPTVNIAGTLSFCTGGSTVLDAGGGYTTYDWSNGDATQTTTITASGIYIVTVTDVNGCTGSASVTVTVNSNLSPAISGALSFCTGGSTVLDAGGGYATYDWSNGDATQTTTITTSGTYSVTVSDMNGCTGSASATVTVNSNLSPAISGVLSFCTGGSTVLDAGGGYATYDWSNGDATQTTTITASGIYIVTVTDATGCTGSASATVVVNPLPVVFIDGDSDICLGETSVLDAGTGFAAYSWNDGGIAQTLDATTSGTYSVTVTDDNGCTGTDDFTLTVTDCPTCIPPLAPVATADTLVVCAGEINTAAFEVSAEPGTVVNWYDAPAGGNLLGSGNTFVPDAPGIYYAEAAAIDDPTCVSGRIELALVTDAVTVSAVANPAAALSGGEVQLGASGSATQGVLLTYNWTTSGNDVLSCNNCTDPTVAVTGTASYTVTAIDEWGCSDSDNVQVTLLLPDNLVIIPNAFSPNGDGVNDVFRINGSNVELVELFVYNRWGGEVYADSGTPAIGWDGTFKGVAQELGVYVYYATVTFTNGTEKDFKGNVTLIR